MTLGTLKDDLKKGLLRADLRQPVSQATLDIICFPSVVVVTYVNVDIHSTYLICLKRPLSCAFYTNLSHLTTNLFLYVLFCVFPMYYDVHLSHLNKDYLLTYLLTIVCASQALTSPAPRPI